MSLNHGPAKEAAVQRLAGVDEARSAAVDLARMSVDLQKLVTQFRY